MRGKKKLNTVTIKMLLQLLLSNRKADKKNFSFQTLKLNSN